jgi:hypothetical protein
LTLDKEFITIVLAVVGGTAAVYTRMGKMVTKEEFTKRIDDLDIKLSAKIDRLTEIKADKDDVNQRLISIETFLRVPTAPKEPTTR